MLGNGSGNASLSVEGKNKWWLCLCLSTVLQVYLEYLCFILGFFSATVSCFDAITIWVSFSSPHTLSLPMWAHKGRAWSGDVQEPEKLWGWAHAWSELHYSWGRRFTQPWPAWPSASWPSASWPSTSQPSASWPPAHVKQPGHHAGLC